jgi:hypothetical protein
MEPWAWDVHLRSSRSFIVYADGHENLPDRKIFSVCLEGHPLVLMPVLIVTPDLVEDAYSEFAQEHEPTGFDWSTVTGATIAAGPTAWRVQLGGDQTLTIFAYSYAIEAGEYVFTLPLGEPSRAMPVARIPQGLVLGIREVAASE